MIKNKEITTYNALRGIGSIGILFSHMTYMADSVNPFYSGFYKYFMRYGSACSSFFFICSGFFLNYAWKDKPFVVYVKSKFKRIYPLTFAVFLLALLVDVIMTGNNIVSEGVQIFSKQWYFNIIANIFLFKSFVPLRTTYYSFHGPSWYISVLFVFYLIAFWIIKGLRSDDRLIVKRSRTVIMGGCCLTYTIQLIICVILHFIDTDVLYWSYVNPYFHIFGECMIGVIICEYNYEIQRIVNRITNRMRESIIEIITVAIVVLFFESRNILKLNISSAWMWVIPFGLTMIVFRNGADGVISKILNMRWMQYIGTISFELYMTHAFVYEGLSVIASIINESIKEWILYHAGTRFIITLVLSIVFAHIIHKLMNMKTMIFSQNK